MLDLDGDGLELSLGSDASFDNDGDGYREETVWVAPDDGFLVMDLAADGTINGSGDGDIVHGNELAFANWTEADDTDMEALAIAGVTLLRKTRDNVKKLVGDSDGNASSVRYGHRLKNKEQKTCRARALRCPNCVSRFGQRDECWDCLRRNL